MEWKNCNDEKLFENNLNCVSVCFFYSLIIAFVSVLGCLLLTHSKSSSQNKLERISLEFPEVAQ